jgi:hypothetical protein
MIEDTRTNAERPLVYGNARDPMDEEYDAFDYGNATWMTG